MKSKFSIISILIVLMISIFSCKKDDSNIKNTTTKTTGHLTVKFSAPVYLATDYADVGVNDSVNQTQLAEKQITNSQTGDFGELNPGTYYLHAGIHNSPSNYDTTTHVCQQCAVQYFKIVANQDKEIDITQ